RQGLGRTGEFMVGHKRAGRIEFVLSPGRSQQNPGLSFPQTTAWGEPMRQALAGRTGLMQGLDYRGHKVLAAYTLVRPPGWGLVAKIDLWEIQAPLLKTAFWGALLTLLFLAASHRLFLQLNRRYLAPFLEKGRQANAILHAASEGIVVADASGLVQIFNPAAQRIFGFKESEVIGRPASLLLPWPEVEPADGSAAEEVSDQPLMSMELEGRRKDGSRLPALASFSSHTQKGSRHVTGIIRDRTEEERSKRDLEEARHRFEEILDSVDEAICGVDREGNITFANVAAAQLLGYPIEELKGKLFHTLAHHSLPDGSPIVPGDCSIHACIVEGTMCHARKEFFCRRDGTFFQVDHVLSPIRSEEQHTGAVLAFRDISRQVGMETQLARAQKLESIGQLAAGIAHEINTPTQYVGDNLNFLKDAFGDLKPVLHGQVRLLEAIREGPVPGPLLSEVERGMNGADLDYLQEEIPLALDQALEGVSRVAQIVSAMREFSHPVTDTVVPVDLNHAIENTITVARNEWKYVAEMQTALDASLPAVPCFPGEFSQVILNLVVNAAHAIQEARQEGNREKGRIGVKTLQDGDWAEIRISDDGTGIPQEVRSRIFDPFFTTKEIGKGTGQGLALAHAVIVTKHGGSLDFESQVGEGSTFIIRLPLNPAGDGGSSEEARPVR
ncbi:MAG: PAS domain S-box protein, partial [Acidobacteriota bacterium]